METIETKDPITLHDFIDEMEFRMMEYPPVDCPLNHIFTPGLYLREVLIPKDSYVTSKIHKTEHPFFVLKGDLTIFTESGGTQRITGPYIGITQAGTRRMAYTHEETIWITVHANEDNETDLDKIEEKIIIPHVNTLLENKDNLTIEESL